ncbi:NADPH-dependent FMN reductase [Chitinivibrio alkaliphilus]|uniref:Flavoprotein n=1 Tax=Chitinivibrio alkaliphilus ACht1 TaxID=1313304 RepID=U7D8K6_9BACT|nr:NAD(P)H-dependent oxidoreductase [Chitinivibrio alkaliphilus]ERP31891.1 flavoprotein [Chitinivibrio alkaliphilus ACht1]
MAIQIISGSIRRKSLHQALATVVAEAVAQRGTPIIPCPLAAHPLPLYNQELEEQEGMPEGLHTLRTKIILAEGLIMASPEYNGSVTPLLKNTIDWLSRPFGDSPYGAVFRHKPILCLAASPGPGGGKKSLSHLQEILSIFSPRICPTTISLPQAEWPCTGETLPEEVQKTIEQGVTELLQRCSTTE